MSSASKIAQVVNVALFGATLLGLGSLLGVQLARSSEQPEISDEENRTLAPLPQISGAAIVDVDVVGFLVLAAGSSEAGLIQ